MSNMTRFATCILIGLVLLALVLETVSETKKGNRNTEEKKHLGDRKKSASKRQESSMKVKEGKGRRWKEERMTRSNVDEDMNLKERRSEKWRGSGKQAEAKKRDRFSDVEKQVKKYAHKNEREPVNLYEEEKEMGSDYEEIECESEKYMEEESTDLEVMDDEPLKECFSKRICKQKSGPNCIHGKPTLAHEDSDGKCCYGV